MENTLTVATNESRIGRLEKAFEKLSGIVVGNGVRGMDEVVRDTEKEIVKINERMEALEHAIGVTNSEINHLRSVYFSSNNKDAMGNPIEKNWLAKTWADKIAPNLFNNIVMAAIIIIILNIHELLDLIATL